jgi:hypothetical protein
MANIVAIPAALLCLYSIFIEPNPSAAIWSALTAMSAWLIAGVYKHHQEELAKKQAAYAAERAAKERNR